MTPPMQTSGPLESSFGLTIGTQRGADIFACQDGKANGGWGYFEGKVTPPGRHDPKNGSQ